MDAGAPRLTPFEGRAIIFGLSPIKSAPTFFAAAAMSCVAGGPENSLMRLLRRASVATCVVAALVLFDRPVPVSGDRGAGDVAGMDGARMVRLGARDVLWAADGDANYSYGPPLAGRRGLAATAAPTAVIELTPDSDIRSNPAALAAFMAAADIWTHIIVSSVPIRVSASFHNLGNPMILGAAGPTAGCFINSVFYSAALYDKLRGVHCTGDGGAEIEAQFNSAFPWDFGTTGTPVAGKINFMTVVMHELGHGLGFFGEMDAVGDPTAGTFQGGFPIPANIFDRFSVTGAGMRLIDFVNPSQLLGQQLVSDDTYFDGVASRATNGGLRPKLETHHFTNTYGILTPFDNGFLYGSSYSHLDDLLYSPDGSGAPRPNGLMTFQLQRAEVYTDPGPIVRGIFQDMGWSLASSTPPCSYGISPLSLSAPSAGAASSFSITTMPGCPWNAVSLANFIAITSTASTSGSAVVTFSVAANPIGAPRSGLIRVAGQMITVSQAAANVIPLPDVDGDGRADLTVFRPSSAEWFIRKSTSNYGSDYLALQWGLDGDQPVAADFDGDGRMELTVYRPSTGEWFIRYSSLNYSFPFATYQWGLSEDVPLAADFDGDRRSDLVVYRPSTGEWFVRYSSTSYSYAYDRFQWGLPGDRPIAADVEGDGRTDLVVFRPSSGEWFVRRSSSQFDHAAASTYVWGLAGDIPVAADFDGDRRMDLAVFRPDDGTWYVRFSSSGYSLDNSASFQWGLPGDIPISADFDLDGRSDLVVYRPDTGEWWVRFSASGYSFLTSSGYQWGLPGDVPMIPGPRP
jgi:hypothetical protein